MDKHSRPGNLAETNQQSPTQPLDDIGMMHAFVQIYNEYTSKLAEIQENQQHPGQDALMQIIWLQKQEIASLKEKLEHLSQDVNSLAWQLSEVKQLSQDSADALSRIPLQSPAQNSQHSDEFRALLTKCRILEQQIEVLKYQNQNS